MNPFDALDNDQVNHAVALALGWAYTPGGSDGVYGYYARDGDRWLYSPTEMPDYAHDMDAAEEVLDLMRAAGDVMLTGGDSPSGHSTPWLWWTVRWERSRGEPNQHGVMETRSVSSSLPRAVCVCFLQATMTDDEVTALRRGKWGAGHGHE